MPGTASFEHAKKIFSALPTIVSIEGSNTDDTCHLNPITNSKTIAFINASNQKLQGIGFSLSAVVPSKNRVIDEAGNAFYLHSLQKDGILFEYSYKKLDNITYDSSIENAETETDSSDEDAQLREKTHQLSPVNAIPSTTLLTAAHRIVIAEQYIAAVMLFHKTKPKSTFNSVLHKVRKSFTQTATDRTEKIYLHKNMHPDNFIVDFNADPAQITVKLEQGDDKQALFVQFYNQDLYDKHQKNQPITPTLASNNYALSIHVRDILSPISSAEIIELDHTYKPKLQTILTRCEELLSIDLTPSQNQISPDQLIIAKINVLKNVKTPAELSDDSALVKKLKTTINSAIIAYQTEIKSHSWFNSGFHFCGRHGTQGIANTTVLMDNITYVNCRDINDIKKQLSYFFNLKRWVDWSKPNANNHSFISYLMNALKDLDPAQLKSLNLNAEVILNKDIDYCRSDMKKSREAFMQSFSALTQPIKPPGKAILTGLATVHPASNESDYRRIARDNNSARAKFFSE